MLVSRRLISRENNSKVKTLVSFYSRKSDAKHPGTYKLVRTSDVNDDVADNRFGSSPNWELLTPHNYRFLMPGSVGPAWHEPGSMVPMDLYQTDDKTNQFKSSNEFDVFDCKCQECPVLLKKGVLELFPGSDIVTSQQVTIVTLTHKKKRRTHKTDSPELIAEDHAKTFVWAAQEICMKLKMAGYWADFINPFSGRPYLSPFYKSNLYETDERFRCFGFEINKLGGCKTISSIDKQFVGSLFTNAPPSASFLHDILNED